MKSTPRPSNPRPTTLRPMTRPPEKATASAEASPVRAAWVVRTLALVATVIPMNPANAEQNAPVTNDTATSGDDWALVRFTAASSAATETTKTASTRYSRLRKARAPSEMAAAISAMRSLPASCRPTQRARVNA